MPLFRLTKTSQRKAFPTWLRNPFLDLSFIIFSKHVKSAHSCKICRWWTEKPECGLCHVMILPAVVIFTPAIQFMWQKQLHMTKLILKTLSGVLSEHKTIFKSTSVCPVQSFCVSFYLLTTLTYSVEEANIIITVFNNSGLQSCR